MIVSLMFQDSLRSMSSAGAINDETFWETSWFKGKKHFFLIGIRRERMNKGPFVILLSDVRLSRLICIRSESQNQLINRIERRIDESGYGPI